MAYEERIFNVPPAQIRHGDLIWWINEWRTIYESNECSPYGMWRLNLDGEPYIVAPDTIYRIKVNVVVNNRQI